MSGFVLNLDLTDYFEDMRKRASIFVDLSKCKEVGDVEKHIKSVFQLTSNTCLTHKQFLMPSSEDIQILKQFEILKVQKRDFFDHQIHQNKQKTQCEQPALNLIQSEKTIDLACRPKQRLNIDFCKSDRIFGSSKSLLDEPSEIQCIKKHKIKKKKHNIQQHEQEVNSCFETSTDILDMSVNKKCRRKDNQNCFSTGEEHNSDVKTDSQVSQNGNCFEIELENLDTQCQRKSKKRKKQLNPVTENEEMDDCISKDNFVSKKHKKARKTNKYPENVNVSEESKNGSKCSTVDVTITENGCSRDKDDFVTEHILKQDYDKYDRILNKNVEHVRIAVNNEDEKEYLETHTEVNKQNVETITNSCLNNADNKSINEEQDVKSYSEFLDKQLKRKKRVRKHNRKSKRQKKELLLAVGPLLKGLTNEVQSLAADTATLQVSKHIFFSDEDFSKEINISTDMIQPVDQGLVENEDHMPSQVPASEDKPADWVQELFKLATSSSPVIIHRSTPAPSGKIDRSSEKTDLSSEYSKNIASETIKCGLPVAEDIILKTSNETPDDVVEGVKKVCEDFRSCNGDIKYVNSTVKCSTANTMSSESNLLPDSEKPVPVVAIENITLTNYPIINKVVTDDLILFKVLKLNENSQPDVSKTILGKVMSTSFPDKVSLLLIENSGECEPGEGADESSESFISKKCIQEFRWRDILEPRLFYP